MKLYLSGPMSGMPAFNIPAFDLHARILRDELGYEVVSPAELDEPEFRNLCLKNPDGSIEGLQLACELAGLSSDTWGDLLARDVKLLADDGIEGIVVLPGWDNSRGALLETYVGRLCGLPVYTLVKNGIRAISHAELTNAHRDAAGHINAVNALRRFIPVNECGIPPTFREKGARFVREGDLDRLDGSKKDGSRMEDWNREVRVTSETGGQKGSKRAVIGDICPKSLKLLAEVAGFGREKYDRLNYLRGFDYSLAYDAAQRHLNEFWSGNDTDEESGLPHLAHAAWQCLCLLAFTLRGVGKDDRP